MKDEKPDERSLAAHRALWQNRGESRPDFAAKAGPGQESVWDYPRPPALVEDTRCVEVMLGSHLIARTTQAKRVLETASPPTFYLPRKAVNLALLRPTSGTSICEWKGRASYRDVVTAEHSVRQAAWTYEDPFRQFRAIAGFISFYPGRVACYVDGQRVRPQDGGFYGGWVTNELVGPWKGQPGTGGW